MICWSAPEHMIPARSLLSADCLFKVIKCRRAENLTQCNLKSVAAILITPMGCSLRFELDMGRKIRKKYIMNE